VGRPFRIRGFEPADRAALERMYEDFEPKRGAQGLPPSGALALRRWLDRVLGEGEHLVLEAEGGLLGHAMLIPLGDGVAELANFVHQSARNRGIGTALNRAVISLAAESGFRRVWLSVEPSNRAALRSYRKAGFRQRPGSHWAPEVEMELELDDGCPEAGNGEARGVQREADGS